VVGWASRTVMLSVGRAKRAVLGSGGQRIEVDGFLSTTQAESSASSVLPLPG
jgi:hypothetical protein